MSIWRPLNPSVQTVKRLPARRETWVRSLGQEDPLEKEMATHSSILAWRIPWTEEPGGLQSTGSQRVGHDWATSLTHSLTRNKVTVSRIHGSPLQNLFNVHLYLFYLVDTFMTLSMSFLWASTHSNFLSLKQFLKLISNVGYYFFSLPS